MDGATRKVVVLGVGNILRGDDGVGPMVVEKLRDWGAKGERRPSASGPWSLVAVNAGEAPEAHLGEIREAKPDIVVIVDAVDFGGRPGEVALLRLDGEGSSNLGVAGLSTHRIPLPLLARYIKEETGAEVVLVGIQPKRIGFGEGMSEEVERAAEAVARMLEEGGPPIGVEQQTGVGRGESGGPA